MNTILFIRGLAGAVVGTSAYVYAYEIGGNPSNGFGNIMSWAFALCAVVCFLVAIYAFISKEAAPSGQ